MKKIIFLMLISANVFAAPSADYCKKMTDIKPAITEEVKRELDRNEDTSDSLDMLANLKTYLKAKDCKSILEAEKVVAEKCRKLFKRSTDYLVDASDALISGHSSKGSYYELMEKYKKANANYKKQCSK